jgi:hypothetical protein
MNALWTRFLWLLPAEPVMMASSVKKAQPSEDAIHTGDTVLEAEGWFGLTQNPPEHVVNASFFPPDKWEALTGRLPQKETRTHERPR